MAYRAAALGAALPVLLAVRVALLLMPWRRLARWMPVADGAAPDWQLRHAIRAVGQAARIVPGATCLPQAVAGRILCAAIGQATLIRIGVRRDGAGKVMAHAWLVDGRGRILLGGTPAEIDRFTPLADLKAEAGA
ncbi:MAG: lasso peptide biosynthesis B2 protein [Sphingobium sp.]